MELDNRPQKNKLAIILSVISLVLVILVSSIFCYLYSQNNKSVEEINVKISNIEQSLEKVAARSEIVVGENTLNEERVLIKRTEIRNYIDQMPKPCTEEMGNLMGFLEKPTEERIFVNNDWGLQISVPYNPLWGEDRFYVKPFDVEGDTLYFGTIWYGSEGCGEWNSEYSIKKISQESKEDLLVRLTDEVESRTEYFKIESKQINGLDVILVEFTGGLGNPTDTYVVGNTHNYQLFGHPLSAFPEELIEGVTLID